MCLHEDGKEACKKLLSLPAGKVYDGEGGKDDGDGVRSSEPLQHTESKKFGWRGRFIR